MAESGKVEDGAAARESLNLLTYNKPLMANKNMTHADMVYNLVFLFLKPVLIRGEKKQMRNEDSFWVPLIFFIRIRSLTLSLSMQLNRYIITFNIFHVHKREKKKQKRKKYLPNDINIVKKSHML